MSSRDASSRLVEGRVSLHGTELLLRFSFSKKRFEAVKKIKGAFYNKEQHGWQIPLMRLSELSASPLFSPDKIEYDFDMSEISYLLRREEERSQSVRRRWADNPFETPESDMALLDLETTFHAAPYGKGLRARVKFGSKAKTLLEDVPGVHYLKNERAYFFPVALLADFLKELRRKGISFAVEAAVGTALRRSAKLRGKIIRGECKATGAQLKEAQLFPYADFLQGSEGEDRFEIVGWTAEQLRHCFPKISSFAERKAKAAAMNLDELLRMIYEVQRTNTKIWLTDAVKQRLDAHAQACGGVIAAHPWGFADELLALSIPPLCWAVGEKGEAGLLCEQERYEFLKSLGMASILKSGSKAAHPQCSGRWFISWPDTKLLEIYRKITQHLKNEQLPASHAFVTLLSDLERRENLLSRRAYYQKLSDIPLGLVNKDLEAKLFPHQRVAVSWLLEMPRAFLGDDMGLGKTLSVLAAYDELKARGEIDFLLVVCPNSLVRNWLREASSWLPDLWFSALPEEKRAREKELAKLSRFGSGSLCGLVVNYETLRLPYVYPELVQICSGHRTLICLDESQRVKNPQSQSFKALREVAAVCPRRVLLSGTPTPKDVSDIWAQILILDDGERFGRNFFRWLERVAELGNKYSAFAVKRFIPEQVEETVSRVHELLLRRRKEDVVNLPEKVFSIRDVELKGEQKRIYEEVRQGLLRRVSHIDGSAFMKEIDSILEEYLRAVQAASNPRLIDKAWQGHPAKFVELDELVTEIVAERGEKMVIWTNYLLNVEELVARYAHYGTAGLCGEVPTQRRAEILAEFQSQAARSTKILVAVPAAGGVGVTLTAAQTAVYVDKTWNAEHWMQSVDRLHRIGQKGTVNIITLNASKVDELIHWNLRRKERAQAKLLGDGWAGESWKPTREELLQAVEK